MILSYNWLKELTGTALSPKDLAEKLTRVGINVEEVTQVGDDWALNAEVTTNRPDWLCHLGVAHEIAAIDGLTVKEPPRDLKATGPDVHSLTSVTVLPGAESACPRYTARVIRGVKVGPSPKWVQDRLIAIGQRPINNIVDVSNLVCFEMNQPLHTFDMDRLAGGRIVLRMAEKGEKFAAITGEAGELDKDMLVISDAEKAVALAGVKGGANTEVSDATVNVLLEAAWFQPRYVRKAARRMKMDSESSYRYERGIDPGMTERASARAAHLICEFAGGELAEGIIDTNPSFGQPWEASMRFGRCNSLLGFEIPADEAVAILQGLGLEVTARDAQKVTVRVPSFRQDLKREADLIEEVIRLAGYDRITEVITMPLQLAHEMPATRTARIVRRTLAALGYHECCSDSFVPADWAGIFAPDARSYTIRNPINAQRPVLRASLIPSLLEVRRTNRLAQDVRLFEIGRTYEKGSQAPVERTVLSIVDDRGPEYVRGALEETVRALGLTGKVTLEAAPAQAGMDSGTGACLSLDGKPFAVLGSLCSDAVKKFDLTLAPAVGQVDLDIAAAAPYAQRTYTPLPRYPGIRRDISLNLPEDTPWSRIEEIARANTTLLDSLHFESLYRGKGVPAGCKALAFSMVFRAADRSLTDDEANTLRAAAADALLAAVPGSSLR